MFLFHQTFQRLCSAVQCTVISLLTGPTDTLISCPIRVPKTATRAQTPWRKGLEEKRRRIKSLGHGFVNSQIWILLWLFWADGDHYVPKVWTMLFGRRFFLFFSFGKRKTCRTICSGCCVCGIIQSIEKFSVGGWESGTDVARVWQDGSTSHVCRDEARMNTVIHLKWAPHSFSSLNIVIVEVCT